MPKSEQSKYILKTLFTVCTDHIFNNLGNAIRSLGDCPRQLRREWDIVRAVQRWQAAHPHTDMRGLTQEQLAEYLSVAYMPDPDLLIRTGGGQRIINFLLWQVAYAGLCFTDELWLEFDTAQLTLALDCYQTRQRRFGQIEA